MFTRNNDGYGGERTHDDGVQKRLPCSNQAFFSRTTVLGHAVCQSRGTNTSDVGKQCALNTDDGHTQNAAGNTFWGECSLEDLHEGIRNLREVKAQNHENSNRVEHGHHRNQAAGGVRDGVNSTDEHDRGRDRDGKPHDPTIAE